MAFAYGGHNVVLEIQATLPHPPSTVKPMMKGVYVAYVIVLWCYFSVSVLAPCFLACMQPALSRDITCLAHQCCVSDVCPCGGRASAGEHCLCWHL